MLTLTKALIPALVATVGVAVLPSTAMADDDYRESYRIRQRALNDYFRNNNNYRNYSYYPRNYNYRSNYYRGNYRNNYRHNRWDNNRWDNNRWNHRHRDHDDKHEYENFSIYSTPYGGLGFSYSEGEHRH